MLEIESVSVAYIPSLQRLHSGLRMPPTGVKLHEKHGYQVGLDVMRAKKTNLKKKRRQTLVWHGVYGQLQYCNFTAVGLRTT
jgi:hypothetical protein